ncbi:hypothetical protein B0H10DRAFT_2238699 [Mycena sp. CBHHK59/15]|nr:hypothetical protein B0H10DRAFT_2238699 [Mycena sp. CBHHK59/15]
MKRPWLILPSCWAHQFQLILGDYFKVNDTAAVIAEDATGLIAWLNNHSKVRVIFNEAQRTIQVSSGAVKIIILAYLVANLTRWTTHFVAFMRLFLLREALEFAVLQNRPAIIAAHVGAATSTDAARLKEDAERFCALIRDQAFWEGLETVLGDLEPGAEPSPSSVSTGGPGAVPTLSSIPHARGINVVAACALATRMPRTREIQTSRTRDGMPHTRDVQTASTLA